MKELFSGNKELFKDTWIYDKWNFKEKYPVIKISFSELDYEKGGLYKVIEEKLTELAKKKNIVLTKDTLKKRFVELIEKLGEKNPVVILIDEYDKPIIDYIENKTKY